MSCCASASAAFHVTRVCVKYSEVSKGRAICKNHAMRTWLLCASHAVTCPQVPSSSRPVSTKLPALSSRYASTFELHSDFTTRALRILPPRLRPTSDPRPHSDPGPAHAQRSVARPRSPQAAYTLTRRLRTRARHAANFDSLHCFPVCLFTASAPGRCRHRIDVGEMRWEDGEMDGWPCAAGLEASRGRK